MLDQYLQNAKTELINGYAKKRHPFRYFSLSTIHHGRPKQRTVVLRKMLSDFSILIFTDSRSAKVSDIAANNEVSALFYHPKRLLQIQLEGKAELLTDTTEIEQYWNNVQGNSIRDYTTESVPGSPINNPDNVRYSESKNHFCVIKLIPETLEYLQLKRPNHIRIRFTKDAGDWNGEFLVP